MLYITDQKPVNNYCYRWQREIKLRACFVTDTDSNVSEYKSLLQIELNDGHAADSQKKADKIDTVV